MRYGHQMIIITFITTILVYVPTLRIGTTVKYIKENYLENQ